MAKKDKNRLKVKKRQEIKQKNEFSAIESLFLNPNFDKYMKAQLGDKVKNQVDMLKPEVFDEIHKYVNINEMGIKLQRNASKIFTDKEFNNEVPIIECDIKDINTKKLELIKENLEIYVPDVSKMFVGIGLINIKLEDRELKIVFSSQNPGNMDNIDDDEEGVVIVVRDGDVVFGGTVIHHEGDKPEILYGYSFDNFTKSIHKNGCTYNDHNYNHYALVSILNVVAVVFYINALATTPVPRREQTTTPQRRSRLIRTSTPSNTNSNSEPKEVVIPRRYKITNDTLLEFDNISGTYRKPAGKHNVSGHWRYYKSGKKIWIDEFERGKGKAKTKKKYIVSDK